MNKTKKIVAMVMLIIMLGITCISTNTFAATTVSKNRGDINGDGKINITDVSLLSAHLSGYRTIKEKEKLNRADYNGDGKVDATDLKLLKAGVMGEKKGDLNRDGKINVADISVINAYLQGIKSLASEVLKLADVDENGEVNKEDAILLSLKVQSQKLFPIETKKGDINLDGKVNKTDYSILLAYIKSYRKFKYSFYRNQADLNGDGRVNVSDLVLLRKMIY